jgi:hypothetical protein
MILSGWLTPQKSEAIPVSPTFPNLFFLFSFLLMFHHPLTSFSFIFVFGHAKEQLPIPVHLFWRADVAIRSQSLFVCFLFLCLCPFLSLPRRTVLLTHRLTYAWCLHSFLHSYPATQILTYSVLVPYNISTCIYRSQVSFPREYIYV